MGGISVPPGVPPGHLKGACGGSSRHGLAMGGVVNILLCPAKMADEVHGGAGGPRAGGGRAIGAVG